MNKISFLDELIKLGGVTGMYKRAFDGETLGDISADIPSGMMGTEPVPGSIRTIPDEAGTRLPNANHSGNSVSSGRLGPVTQARNPIDRERFNKIYRERR